MRTRVRNVAEASCLVAVPAVLLLCGLFQFDQTALLSMLVVCAAVGIFLAGFESSRPALRQIMPTVVMAALAAGGRVLFGPIPDFKPVSAVCIMSGALFGRRCGFMVGALAALVSNFFLGQGPWTPWQMYSWGLIGYLAGVLQDCGALRHRGVLYGFGALSGYLFGLLMNGYYVVGYVHPLTWESATAALLASLAFDTTHAVATVLFLAVLYQPWKRKLERIKRKYALGEIDKGRA